MGLADRDYMRRRSSPDGEGPDWPELRWWLIAFVITTVGMALWLYSQSQDASGKAELLVNVNTASVAQLESLPGVGPAIAGLIIAHRPYATVDDLARVHRIGARMLADLRPLLTVTEPTRSLVTESLSRRLLRELDKHDRMVLVAYGLAIITALAFVLRWVARGGRRWFRGGGGGGGPKGNDPERRRWEGHKRIHRFRRVRRFSQNGSPPRR